MLATPPTVAVLTALPLEYEAIRTRLTSLEKHIHPSYGTRAEVGLLPGTAWRVALLEMGEGTRGAAALTERVMSWFTPQAVLFVGVAGGLKDDIDLGDVVVATKVYAVHGGKETPDGFLDRPETWHAPHHLESAARHALRGQPHIHFKPIAASEVLLADADSPLAQRLRQRFNDAVAIEMEGSGVAHAAHLAGTAGALIIRGISDRADADKARADARGSQPGAAARAAEAAVAVLRELEPKQQTQPSRDSSPDPVEGSTHGPTNTSPYTGDYLDFRGSTFQAAFTAKSHATPQDQPPAPPTHTHGPVPTASATLPPRPLGFTGRRADLGRVLPHLAPTPAGTPNDTPASPLLISAVTGMGGIGKTALAIEAAHQACSKGWFPGGTLFVDLRGYDDNPVTADQAILALLDALGVSGPDLPTTTARQYDTYRTLFAERRAGTLLILDNASDPSQFLPLLPGAGPHRVLITSRDRPDSLPLRLIDLETLTEDDSTALVTTALHNADEHDDRPSREPDALRELTALCGHLPLALQIAAAMLRRRRNRGVASLVAEIKRVGDPTVVLDNGGRGTDQYGRSLTLRPVLETSYHRLPPDQARLLRLLALSPGTDTGTEAVAALTDLDVYAAAALLEDLAAAGLVTAVVVGGDVRWRLHDLVRAFGVGVVSGDAGLREEGEEARGRLLRFYGRWADAADDRLRWLPGMAEPERFADRGEALKWLDRERAGLVGAAQWAGEERYALQAVRLAGCLAEYLDWRRYFDDWITVAGAAREAAHRAGDRLDEANAWIYLGLALREAGRVGEAIDAHTHARTLFQEAKDRHREAISWDNLGLALQRADRMGEAIDAHTHARTLFQEVEDRHREAMAWNNLGLALRKADRTEEAIDAHTHARTLFQEAKDRHREGTAWNNLGLALRKADRAEGAIEAYANALEIHCEFEDWYGAGQTLTNLGVAHEAARRPAEARTCYLQAADAYTRANAPTKATQVRTRAEELN